MLWETPSSQILSLFGACMAPALYLPILKQIVLVFYKYVALCCYLCRILSLRMIQGRSAFVQSSFSRLIPINVVNIFRVRIATATSIGIVINLRRISDSDWLKIDKILLLLLQLLLLLKLSSLFTITILV